MKASPDRGESTNIMEYFSQLYIWFANEMTFAGTKEIYLMKYIDRHLENCYCDDMIISQCDEKPNNICFKGSSLIIAKLLKDNQHLTESG